MKKSILAILGLVVIYMNAGAQSVPAEGDAFSRGYINRPYLRYEAEPEKCTGNAEFLIMDENFSQERLESEASNNICAVLKSAGDKVEWIADAEADALSLRFSIPDSADGKGRTSVIGLYVNGNKIKDIELNSFWAWQYIAKGSSTSKHPDNTPADGKFVRMRFDEVYVCLPSLIKKDDKFALVKDIDDSVDCTIDFLELEKIPAAMKYEDLSEPKVRYEGDGSTLQNFINSNPGKIIFIPEGDYTLSRRIMINNDNTQIIGAGMWRTRLYFSADASNRSTYSNRGFESYANNITLQGFSMNSASNIRYLNNNESMGVGKGLQGSFGKNSVIRDVRIDHFECGAWIGDYGGVASDGLRIEKCRFRNNYADGVNLCSGTINAKVIDCSFRNNGDDDMASWSTGHYTANNEFAYCTAEHNWRASSLGFFGGRGNKANHISITDGMEAGMRVTADFEGTGFASNNWFEISDVYIARCGTPAGTQGISGDLWGNWQPSVRIQSGYHYDINNLRIENVYIKDSRHHAVSITANGGKKINNLELHNIHINGAPVSAWGVHIANNVVGSGHYSNIVFENVTSPEMSNIPINFDFKNIDSSVDKIQDQIAEVTLKADGILIKGIPAGVNIEVFNITGIAHGSYISQGEETFVSLPKGIYIVKIGADSIKVRL